MPAKPKQTQQKQPSLEDAQQDNIRVSQILKKVLDAAAALLWIFVCTSLAGRSYFVLTYAASTLVPSFYEPLIAPPGAWLFSLGVMAIWLAAHRLVPTTPALRRPWLRQPIGWLASACLLPFALIVARVFQPNISTSFMELLWFAFLTGGSFAALTLNARLPAAWQISWRASWLIVMGLTVLSIVIFYAQSVSYFDDFLLGFNDFGHFTQRIANSAAGRGWLLESPVLPTFWDHFNPGLLLIVPMWKLWPSVQLIFVLQACALCSPALIILSLARSLGAGPRAGCCWALAWLAQPVVSQCNIAYTYGWHPISMAIVPMLVSFWAMLSRRYWVAGLFTLLAVSFEEGVIVVYGCLTTALALHAWLQSRNSGMSQIDSIKPDNCETNHATTIPGGVAVWLSATGALVALFLVVYRFSGLAEFQTGRFHALGGNVFEIALSPIQKPAEFWGQIFQTKKAVFVLSLLIPVGIGSVLRGWRISLATALPLLVLIVWDHQPATCIAFQYTSALLPVLWFSSLIAAVKCHKEEPFAVGTLVSGLTLSLFIGQLPFSLDSILDVKVSSYVTNDPNGSSASLFRSSTPWDIRGKNSEAGPWLVERLKAIRDDGGAVLATSRIAAHVIGNEDVETVGQFLERREKLSLLPDRQGRPLLAYRWIVLDRLETFQQTVQQISVVESEAKQLGFQVVHESHQIVILKKAN